MRRLARMSPRLDALGELDLLDLREQRVAADLLQEQLQRVGRALDHEPRRWRRRLLLDLRGRRRPCRRPAPRSSRYTSSICTRSSSISFSASCDLDERQRTPSRAHARSVAEPRGAPASRSRLMITRLSNPLGGAGAPAACRYTSAPRRAFPLRDEPLSSRARSDSRSLPCKSLACPSGHIRPTATSCSATAAPRRSSSIPAKSRTSSCKSWRRVASTPLAVLVTHGHLDHVGAVATVAAVSSAPVYMSRDEAFLLERINDRLYPGLGPYEPYQPDHLLDGGEQLEIGPFAIDVLSVPGHSPAHLAFQIRGSAVLGRRALRGSRGADRPAAAATGRCWKRASAGCWTRCRPRRSCCPGHGDADDARPPSARRNPFLAVARRP